VRFRVAAVSERFQNRLLDLFLLAKKISHKIPEFCVNV